MTSSKDSMLGITCHVLLSESTVMDCINVNRTSYVHIATIDIIFRTLPFCFFCFVCLSFSNLPIITVSMMEIAIISSILIVIRYNLIDSTYHVTRKLAYFHLLIIWTSWGWHTCWKCCFRGDGTVDLSCHCNASDVVGLNEPLDRSSFRLSDQWIDQTKQSVK